MRLQQQEVPTEEVAAPPAADDVAAPPPVAHSFGRLQLKRSFAAYAQEELSAAANTCGFVTTQTHWAYSEDCDKSGDKSEGSEGCGKSGDKSEGSEGCGKSGDSGTHPLPYIDVLKRTRVHSAVLRECSSTGRVTSAQVVPPSLVTPSPLVLWCFSLMGSVACSMRLCLVVETDQTATL